MQIAGATLLPMGHPERLASGGTCLQLRIPVASGRLTLVLDGGQWTLLSPVIRFSAADDGPRFIATADHLLTLRATTHPSDLGDGEAILDAFAADFVRATHAKSVNVDRGTVADMHDALTRAARLSGWSLFSATLHPDDQTGSNPVNLVPPANPKRRAGPEPAVGKIFSAILAIFRPTSSAFAVANGAMLRVSYPIEALPENSNMSGHDLLEDATWLRRLLAEKGEAGDEVLDDLFRRVIEEGPV